MVSDFNKGIFNENPIFVMALGLCPALAVSGQVVNALGMGAAVLFVLLSANIFVSLLKNFIPPKVRIPSYIVIIASFVTIVDLTMQAYLPDLSAALGVFVQLIVVNCVILGRAEAFASKSTLSSSVFDALGMALGFTVGLAAIAFVREVLGAGTITLIPIGGFDGTLDVPLLAEAPARVMALPAGALLAIGFLMAGFNALKARREEAARSRSSAQANGSQAA
ncbi:MAG: electron transport complex subunit RsxE [Spirochaetaceae bacterium]